MPLCFITVRGVDYEAADPLVATFTQGSVQGDTIDVTLTILNDEAVEGQHQFTAAVENVSPVIAGPAATIVIMDNDSEYTCLYNMQLLYVWWISVYTITEPPTCGQDHPYNLLQTFRIFSCISIKLSDHAPFV